jgi:hypothetical protein
MDNEHRSQHVGIITIYNTNNVIITIIVFQLMHILLNFVT